MNAETTVRDARIDDLETIVEFNAALAHETENLTLDRDRLREGVRRVLQCPEAGRYFVAEDAGTVAGQCMVTYEWTDWRNGLLWWFQSVYVSPAYRLRGVFRTLYHHVETLARAEPDVVGLRLYVEQHNETAMNSYRALGMRPSGYVVFERDWSGSNGSRP